jgi:hypothetical protein
MAYTSWSVTYGEQPSAAKWNILGTNDAFFEDFIIGTNSVHAAWTSFTPSWTNLTVGNATQQGRYCKYGTLVVCSVNIVFGNTSAMGANPTLTLPVTASSTMYGASGLMYCGWSYFTDSGTANYAGFVRMTTTTTVSPLVGNAASTYLGESGLSSTVPMTWTTNDQLNMYFSYQSSS